MNKEEIKKEIESVRDNLKIAKSTLEGSNIFGDERTRDMAKIAQVQANILEEILEYFEEDEDGEPEIDFQDNTITFPEGKWTIEIKDEDG